MPRPIAYPSILALLFAAFFLAGPNDAASACASTNGSITSLPMSLHAATQSDDSPCLTNESIPVPLAAVLVKSTGLTLQSEPGKSFTVLQIPESACTHIASRDTFLSALSADKGLRLRN